MRYGLTAAAVLAAGVGAASAQTPVQRGDYLVYSIMACGNCHSAPGPKGAQMPLAGGLTFDTPGFKVTAPNITPDRETGIGTWTDQQIKDALVKGVRPNGVHLAMMASEFFKVLTPGDLDAIVAYLRSVKPIRNKVPDPIYKVAIKHDPYPPMTRTPTAAELKDPVVRGNYLVTIGHCMECHTPRIKGRQDFANDLGKGGREFPGPWGKSVSPNITSSKAKGLGAWSDAEIKRAITQGVSRDGRKLLPPMAYAHYARISEPDLSAMVAYLRTVPARE